MKKNLLFLLCGLNLCAAPALVAADSNATNDVNAAVSALSGEPNYSWRTVVDAGPNARFRPGAQEGKTEKGGYTVVSVVFQDNTNEIVIQGTKAAIRTADNGWQSGEEAGQDNGGGFNPASMLARMAQNFRTPADEAARLAGMVQDLIPGPTGTTGQLTGEGAKSLLTLFRRGNNGNAPSVSGAKGSVTFWITDGRLVKFRTHVTGTVSFNGNDRDVDRTTTTEIMDVGSTKVEVPDEAKTKLK